MLLWGTGDDGQDGYNSNGNGNGNGKQWALGGDTFVVGCRIPEYAVVFPEFNTLNPDMRDERYNTECGIYEAGCGIDKLMLA